jgi:hypothetical protein
VAASFSDASQLALDPTFQARVGASLWTYCQVVATEGWTVAFHRERAAFVNQIFNVTTTTNPYIQLFSNTVASDTNVLADATIGGTVILTVANRTAQAALVTDTHISNAIASQFNSYIREPAG